ncbi:hypothetical protein PybrP1_003246 [[Pythium] brassicae (nom. inval.)]|nr:hypothetical protein PybrP1_003246 [[Pythium] brassicae (nom. inval.)]
MRSTRADAALPIPTTSAAAAGGAAPFESLAPVNGSGVNTAFRDAILFAGRHELVLAVGKHAALQHLQTQELSFLPAHHASHPHHPQQQQRVLGEITAMALCAKRRVLALCRAAARDDTGGSGGGSATVAIYSLTPSDRRLCGRLRVVLGFDVERFSSAALSPDGALVCGQAATASGTLVVWDWARRRQIAAVDVHCKVTRVRFNVADMAQLSTSGGNLLRLWTLAEYTLRALSSFQSGDETTTATAAAMRGTHYVDHVWLPGDCVVALLEDGDVQLIVNAALVQTLRGVHGRAARLTCMCALSNGEGVVLGGTQGLVSIVRVGAKVMKRAEKEMQLQRRMRVGGAHVITSVATDPAAATLLCCTESRYGSYDLSDLCFLRGDDEIVSLVPLASTPIASEMKRLSVASRKPCFAGLCTLSTGENVVNVWDLQDAHRCCVSYSLDGQPLPLCVDIHPSGFEVLVSFSSKVHIYTALQDTLSLAFEIQQKQLSIVQYSQTGSMFAGVHAANKMIYVYLSFTRHQREPQLVGIYKDFRDAISVLMWSLHDSSFFGVDASGEIRHCRLRSHCGGEIEDFIATECSCRVQAKGNAIASLKTWRVDQDSHNFVLFGVEKPVACASSSGGSGGGSRHAKPVSCYIRAWINGDLTRDAIKSSGTTASRVLGESVPFEVTILGVGCSNLLFAGTAGGAVVIMSWKLCKRNQEGQQSIRILPHRRRIDLHTSPVCGVFYYKPLHTLVTNSTDGVVLACLLHQEEGTGEPVSATEQLRAVTGDDDYFDTSTTFSSVSQADEAALYNQSKIDLRKLRMMDLESELQQVKLENELLTKQIGEQKEKFEERIRTEVGLVAEEANERQRRLQTEMDSRIRDIARDRDARFQDISSDARIAQDQYLRSLEKLQTELDTSELALTQQKLHEVLRQQDQDQLAQLSMLSTTIDVEKSRAANQMTDVQGRMAGLNQELKLLLTALTSKDDEVQAIAAEHQEKAAEVARLKERLREESRAMEHVLKEKAETAHAYNDLNHAYENLQRLNNVHRSQIELLQKQLMPKDREIEKMQQYLNQLHDANQDIVVQANLSDRLRNESASKAKRFEKDIADSERRLEKTRHSIVVLQEELGELVKVSAVQEKSAVVGEVVRIHKRLTRQLDILQAKDDSSEEITAELHRQNGFLLKNKQHLRHQMEIANKEKRKLASALSFQNSTLMAELNALKKHNKELERKVQRAEEREREQSHEKRAKTVGYDGVKIGDSEDSDATKVGWGAIYTA